MGRVMALWCPDWPVTAAQAEAGIAGRTPAGVFSANVVVACNDPARSFGIRRGMRRRDAQARCPELGVLPANPDRDARAFESVLETVEAFRPGVAPLRPGLAALPAPGRFYGGEEAAAAQLSERLVEIGIWDNRSGVADELFTAEHAARGAATQASVIVPVGASAPFLRELPVDALDDPDAGGLLHRLGIHTLGQLAELPHADVRARFGPHVAFVHAVVHGAASPVPASRTPPPELVCEVGFEPPLDSSETICFSSRLTADRFVEQLAHQGLVCTELKLEVFVEGSDPDDEPDSWRTWLHPRWFTATDVIERLHWQLQGRLRAGDIRSPVALVRLIPLTAVPESVHAEVLWGGGTDDQVARGLAKVQGMLGHDKVVRPQLQGGRTPRDRQAMVPWGERADRLRPTELPWPGSIPAPAPSVVLAEPWSAEVVDRFGKQVVVDDRGALSGEPARFRTGAPGTGWVEVGAWAGPWPVDEHWWEPLGRRVERFQLVSTDGLAWLLCRSEDGWMTEAAYE